MGAFLLSAGWTLGSILPIRPVLPFIRRRAPSARAPTTRPPPEERSPNSATWGRAARRWRRPRRAPPAANARTSPLRTGPTTTSSTAAVVPWEPSVEPHGHSPWSPEIAKRFRGSNPGHPLGVSGHPHVRPEWGDIPPTYPLLHHRVAHGQRPWRNGGVVNPTAAERLPEGRPPAQGQPPTHAAPPGSTPFGSGSRWPS